MLRNLKLSLLRASRSTGVSRLIRDSAWRRRQLLILCYHGISIEDEHEWAPGLYMSADTFAGRLDLLSRGGYSILPLDEAVRRLGEGTLPSRSVAITFDDGNFDFYSRAWPLLRRHGVPCTVYLTTYYSEHDLPVFPVVVSYLLWRGRGRDVTFPLGTAGVVHLDLRSAEGRRRAQDILVLHAQDEGMSATEKDALAGRVADAVDEDYAELKRKRLLHIMRPDEVRELSAAGADVQLHTHRHRSPLDREAYRAEIADNRERITALTGTVPRHFCYPSGVCMPQFESWLNDEGVITATTCEPGLAAARTPRLRLPRLLDHSDMTGLEYEAWLTGVGALLPHRPVGFQPVDREGRLIIRRSEAPAPDASPTGRATPSPMMRV